MGWAATRTPSVSAMLGAVPAGLSAARAPVASNKALQTTARQAAEE
jgi:hypothetical protein